MTHCAALQENSWGFKSNDTGNGSCTTTTQLLFVLDWTNTAGSLSDLPQNHTPWTIWFPTNVSHLLSVATLSSFQRTGIITGIFCILLFLVWFPTCGPAQCATFVLCTAMLCFLFVRPVVNICFYVRMRLFMLCFFNVCAVVGWYLVSLYGPSSNVLMITVWWLHCFLLSRRLDKKMNSRSTTGETSTPKNQ